MSYGVEFDKNALDTYYGWALPFEVYEEVDRLLERELSMEPTKYLRDLGDVLEYNCRVPWPGEPPCVHFFLFRVRYSQDEQTLIIWDCYHLPLKF